MPCAHPVRIQNDDLSTMIRCGKCRYCLNRRRFEWVGRLLMEQRDHFSSRFITLTYRDDNRPDLLDYTHFQQFMKRYRYHYGECRYFGVGEYGDKTGHAHWHAIIFGHRQLYRGHWPDNAAWEHGFSFDGNVTLASITYVAGYALKATQRSKPHITRMSLRPGIGLQRLEKLGAELAGTPITSYPSAFSIAGKRYPLCNGGLIAFKRGFLDAGGLEPPTINPDERHTLALEALSDLGTRIEVSRMDEQKMKGSRTSVTSKTSETA